MSENFEKIVRDKFESFESELNPALFDSIVSARKKKKRIVLWWRWSGAAVILLSISAGLIYWLGTNENTPALQPNLTENEASKPILPEKALIPEPELDVNNPVTDTDQTNSLNQHVRTNTSHYSSNETVVDEQEYSQISEIGDTDKESYSNPDDVDQEVEETAVTKEDSDVETMLAGEVEPTTPAEPNETLNTDDLVGPTFIPSAWSVDLIAAPAYINSKYIGNAESVQLRRETESAAISYAFEIGLNYSLNKNWGIRTAMNYQVHQIAFDYSNTEELVDRIVSTKEVTIYHPVNPPQTLIVKDTSYSYYTKVTENHQLNKFTAVRIPLELEHKFYFGNNWMLLGKAGVLLNVYNAQNGLRQVSENQIVSLTELEKDKIGTFSASMGVGAAYRFDKRVQMLVYPQLIYQKQGSDQIGVSQNNLGIFGNFGLRIDL